jgi:hypothetical protein
MYCVYFTSYRGNKLPPFYIGSTEVNKILNKYRGSVASKEYSKIWKSEQRNNPELFKVKILSIHHTRQEAYDAEDKLLRWRGYVASCFYINKRCAKGLNYHPTGINSPRCGVKHTDKAKALMSLAHKGKIISKEQRLQKFNKNDRSNSF